MESTSNETSCQESYISNQETLASRKQIFEINEMW